MPAVQVRGVHKAFGGGTTRRPVLKGLDFTANAGELIAIVGPSGCGKTTLLSIVAGTLAADAGAVEVLGRRLHVLSERQLTQFRRECVGFVFQQFNLIPTLSVIENVCVPLLIGGLALTQAKVRAQQALAAVGLADRGQDQPRNLSGGQQQRVAIARAVVHEPRLVICDEPSSALDKDTGARVMDLLREVARQADRTVIVVTHDNRILSFADRVELMEDGRIERHPPN